MKRTMVLSAMTAVGLLCAAGQAQVVISQVYGGGGNSGAPLRSDFVELKNIGSTPVTMTGWSIQYASATGNFSTNVTALPTFTLQPGQYFLVKEADGANTSAPALPTPDATGTIAMGSGGGKIALVNSTTALTGAGLPNATIVDFVGYGAANNFEGTGGTAPTSNTTAVSRGNNGCQDTNDNAADFVLGAPSPHNSTTTVPCGVTFPDVTLQLSNSGCTPTLGGGYTVTAQVGNTGTAAANGVTVSLVLPPALTYVSNTGGASYDAGTRTVTWNTGTVVNGGSASLDVVTTVNANAGLYVTGSVSTVTPNDPVGNNTAVSNNESLSTAPALSTILVASSSDSSIASNVDENGFPRQMATIYRTFTSQDGSWIIFRTDLTTGGSDANGAVVVGHNTGSGWAFNIVAHEGPNGTAPLASQPNSKIDSNTFGNIQGINNSGEYVYSCRLRDQAGTPADNTDDTLNWVVVKGTVAGGVSSVIKGGDTNHAGNVGADAATAPELAGRNYITVFSSTIQNDGSVSFGATLSGSTASNAAFVSNNGATLRAQKGVTVPGNSSVAWSALDSDSGSDGRGLMVSADGLHWVGTGAVNTANTATDNVVVIDGTVAVQEGSPVGTFTDGAGWATFGSQEVPWVQMLPDASWIIHGYNPATAGFNQGQDWVIRSGTLLASTGSPIVPSSTETWADNVLQRTFFLEAGSGDSYVVGGLTNRSTAANGSDTATDGVVVYRGSSVLVREGNPVTVVSTDGSNTQSTYYLNLINDNRSFVAGGKLYMAATLRTANSICTNSFSNLPQAIVAIDLPATNPCPADIGAQGGEHHSDGLLNNNDFVVFIDYFFTSNPLADVGAQGGEHHSDGQFNNNDFVVFIDLFFQGC